MGPAERGKQTKTDSPKSVQGLARLLLLLQGALVYAGNTAPTARLGHVHVYPADSDLGPFVLSKSPPPPNHDAVLIFAT